MDDDRKRPRGGKPPRATAGGNRDDARRPYAPKPGPKADGERKPFRADKPYAKRADGDAPRKRSNSDRPAGGEAGRPNRGGEGFAPRKRSFADRGEGADRKPFRERTGDGEGRSSYKPRRPDGDRPPRDENGPRREDGLPKYYGKRPGRREREEAGGEAPRPRPARFDGERTFKPRDGEARGPRKFDGDRPPRREGERTFKPRDGEARGPRKFDGDRPPRRDGERSFTPRPRRDDAAASTAEPERIAKRLARAGISSRRDAEDLIAQGRVKVNGRVLDTPAFNVAHNDRIEVDGNEIPAIERTRLFLFHKPAGLVTTNRDPEGRKTVFDVLPEGLPRLMTVGRLDINTEGLLLLTNDGGLSRVLELPATGWMRRYRVRVHGKVDEKQLASLKEGIAVEGVFYGAIEASLEREQGTNAWLSVGLREGKNREVKNILGALGLEVNRLIRVSYGPFQLGELEEGHVMEIRGRTLRDQLGDKLIEESGANFEADIARPFSNKPVRRGEEKRFDDAKPVRRPREVNVGEGGLVKGFRRDRERAREELRDRLTTSPHEGRPDRSERGDRPERAERGDRPPRRDGPPRGKFGDKPAGRSGGGKPGGKRGEDETSFEPPAPRRANVWMAPGAKPKQRASDRAAAKRDGASKGGSRPPRGDGRSEGRNDRPGGGFGGKPRGKPPRKG